MMRSSALLVAVTAAACTDGGDLTGPVAPRAPTPPEAVGANGLLTGVTGLASEVLSSVLPAISLDRVRLSEQSASKVIGREGGQISVGDVVLRVPAGALSAPTKITMTLPAGPFVQAQFAPHGLRFNKPAELQFGLAGTSGAGATDLVGAYYTNPILSGQIPALELRPAVIKGGAVVFPIDHFSRYAPARGYTAAGG